MFSRLPLLLLVVLAWTGCSDGPFNGGESGCDDGTCTCQPKPGSACVGECLEPGCHLACRNGEDCQVTCGDDCASACTDVTNCETRCGDGCDLACDRLSSCNTTCGAGCRQRCSDVSNCAFTVGAGSEVTCQRVGNCNVTCEGTCRVRCENTGNCNVNCAPGGNATVCPDGTTRVCGQPC